ncbi:MAG: hypothetical protein NTV49_00530, partial [Kiritimatiellaeota bacterium]|nr:hypothetical protein [Kiritimatiellota bacterium]
MLRQEASCVAIKAMQDKTQGAEAAERKRFLTGLTGFPERLLVYEPIGWPGDSFQSCRILSILSMRSLRSFAANIPEFLPPGF